MIISLIALFFALTGGALAAQRFIITSTNQIKPGVLTKLRGRTGPKGNAGPAGPVGSTGQQGAAGAPGATGAQGPQGSQGPTGSIGAQGREGPSGSKGDTGAIGPAGPKGDTGATGPAGPSAGAATYWFRTDSHNNVLACGGSEGGCPQYVGQDPSGVGMDFQFPSDVSACAILATTETDPSSSYSNVGGVAAVNRNRGNPNTGKIIAIVPVGAGVAAGSLGFDVAVYCS
jgi:hypothetical protein